MHFLGVGVRKPSGVECSRCWVPGLGPQGSGMRLGRLGLDSKSSKSGVYVYVRLFLLPPEMRVWSLLFSSSPERFSRVLHFSSFHGFSV